MLYRTDIAFAKPELFKHLAPKGIGFALRFPYHDVFQWESAHLSVRSVEWLSRKPTVYYRDFAYQAQS